MKYILDDKTYLVEIVRKNNKNTYVRIKENLIIYVTVPYFVSKKQILILLDNNKEFLRRSISKQVKKEELASKTILWGKEYHLIISNLFSHVEIDNSKIYSKSVNEFDKWKLKEMKQVAKERYDYYYKTFEEKIPYFELKFRSMKTRWGVCNRKSKTITLNTNLLNYELRCLDYVIVHELSHLIEFNHSSSFWRVVEKYYPDYKVVRRILKD